jgi:hypothetical protein
MSIAFTPIPSSINDIRALRSGSATEPFDLATLADLARIERMLHNGLTVTNLDTQNHLLGVKVDWGGTSQVEINIPQGGQQTIENFQFMTIWFREIRVDPPVRLTNTANFACFYEVNKLLGNGQNQQMQIVNPAPGSSELYDLDVGQRLIVVPVSMVRYVLNIDPALRCLHLPA